MDAIVDFNGRPACRLQLPDGSTALIALQGAQLLSWNPAGKGERIYLSPAADFAGPAPLRGGVPVIFPQFAEQGPLPRHGFARTATWHHEGARYDPQGGYASATFRLQDDASSQALWPHAFRAELTVAISQGRLDMELEVENPGTRPLSFQAALHTYLKVAELEECHITGLYGLTYLDCLNGQQQRDTAPELAIDDEIDRIYKKVERPLLLSESQRALAIHAEGFPDAVIWNPWEHKCASLADMPANGFRHMLCIEAGAIHQPVQLDPGAAWWGRQTLICV